MKKTIKNIIIIMAVAMLFISCNADLANYGKGIFESMMTSAPNADYTIKRFAGIHGDDFIVETEAGIATLSTDGSKKTIVEALHPEVAFTLGNDLYYKVKNENKADILLKKVSFDDLETKTDVTIKNGVDNLKIDASFYEDGNYYLLLSDGKGYHYLANSSMASINSENVITFSEIHKCIRRTTKVKEDDKEVEKEIVPDSTTYIGEGYYTVKYNNSWYVYNMADGTEVIYEKDKPFSSCPMAVENDYLFLQAKDNNLYKIIGKNSISPVTVDGKPVKHTITYLQPNHDIPMLTASDGTVYGCYGANPFSLKGNAYNDHESIGSGVVIIDVIQSGDKFYAFSAENGLYVSADGKSYKRAN